jgi:hypothetical protein
LRHAVTVTLETRAHEHWKPVSWANVHVGKQCVTCWLPSSASPSCLSQHAITLHRHLNALEALVELTDENNSTATTWQSSRN